MGRDSSTAASGAAPELRALIFLEATQNARLARAQAGASRPPGSPSAHPGQSVLADQVVK